jgi:hypothetical protein
LYGRWSEANAPAELPGADHYTASRIAEVAQLVEHRSEKPGVDSSILSLGTTILNTKLHLVSA